MNKKNQFIYTIILFAIILASLAIYAIRSTTLNGNFQWDSLFFFLGIVSSLVVVYCVIRRWQKKLLDLFYIFLSVLAICFCTVLFWITADLIPVFITVSIVTIIAVYACDSFLSQKFNSKIPVATKYIITMLGCSIFTVFHVWNIIGSRQLSSTLKKAQAHGYMLHPEECNEMYIKKVKYKENGGELVLASCKIISDYYRPIFRELAEYDNDQEAFKNPATAKKMEQILSSLKSEFEILEQGLSYPQQIIPIQFPEALDELDSMIIPHLSHLNDTARLLVYKFMYEVKLHKDEKALKTVQQIFKIAALLETDPLLLSQLVKNNIESKGLRAIKTAMNNKLSAQMLKDFLKIVEMQCSYRPLKLESEIMYLHSIFSLWQKRKRSYSPAVIFRPDGLLKQDAAYGLEKLMYMVFLDKKGEKAIRYSWKNDAKEKRISYWYVISGMCLPALEGLNHNNFSRLAIARCVFTAIQLRLFEEQTKKFPTDIKFLVNKFPICTSDPFTGKTLIYKNNIDECVIYSIGDDMKDNGGAVLGLNHKTRTQDVGVSLRKEK